MSSDLNSAASSTSDLPTSSSANLLSGRKAARSLRIFQGLENEEHHHHHHNHHHHHVHRHNTNDESRITSPIKENLPQKNNNSNADSLDLEPVSSATYIPHIPVTETLPDEPITPILSVKPQHLTANLEYDHGLNGDITKISSVYSSATSNNKNNNNNVTSNNKSASETASHDLDGIEDGEKPVDFPLTVELKPFKNKVGGHTAIFSFSRRAVCKGLLNRENCFYETIESNPTLSKFTPKYIGLLNVRYSDLPEVSLDDNLHMIPESLKQYSSSFPSPKFSSDVSPVPSLTNSPVQRPNMGSTSVNTELQVQVLEEVFQPLKLHDSDVFTMDEESSQNSININNTTTNTNINNNNNTTHNNNNQGGPSSLPSSTPEVLLRKHTRFERFIVLEDLTCDMKQPCVLDLKMGTRQYGIEATRKKQESQRAKCLSTTSRELGVRVCGLQVFKHDNQKLVKDKYFGRRIKIGKQFCKILAKFLYNGHDKFSVLSKIPHLIDQLKELYLVFNKLPGYRMYGSLVLLMYEGGDIESDEVKVKIIDFAQSVLPEEDIEGAKIPPRHPQLPDLGYLRGLNSLIAYFIIIFDILSGTKFKQTEDMTIWVKENEDRMRKTPCPWLDEYAELENLPDGGINEDIAGDPFDIYYPRYTSEEDEGISE
ncbi:Inositol hexakisphosphate kinase 1 [Candida viswanathii]|uniref:Kinase n=1 Tax=Candida viswanathii TaxID=5486 RepID=A0A367Y252_9ASCO|nr:Inositol hexakisphosphate kinase 1 [Candida viswanathii]